jgi:hypothetical protein
VCTFRSASGTGVALGVEGLRAMTQPKGAVSAATCCRWPPPHDEERASGDDDDDDDDVIYF